MGAPADAPAAAFVVDDRHLVAWRTSAGEPRVGSDVCPHMGASLAAGHVRDDCVVCPWHGLTLGPRAHGAWRPLPAHDDGVLVWVRPGSDDEATPAPILPKRPDRFVDAVMRVDARCEPRDVIANRLDPWHGTHLHPYSFSQLEVTGADDDELRLDVTYRVVGHIGVPVRVTFVSPEPRTVVMTITDGDYAGSVVETHATPLGPGRTAIIEATLATSDRSGFRHVQRFAAPVRAMLGWAARRLWVDDAAYAERLYALRTGAVR